MKAHRAGEFSCFQEGWPLDGVLFKFGRRVEEAESRPISKVSRKRKLERKDPVKFEFREAGHGLS